MGMFLSLTKKSTPSTRGRLIISPSLNLINSESETDKKSPLKKR